jgi:hypothetical protein
VLCDNTSISNKDRAEECPSYVDALVIPPHSQSFVVSNFAPENTKKAALYSCAARRWTDTQPRASKVLRLGGMLPIGGRPINADRRPKFPCGVRISPDTQPPGLNTASRGFLDLPVHDLSAFREGFGRD